MRILHLLAGTGWGGAERMGCTIHELGRAHGHDSRIDAPALPEIVRGAREVGCSLGHGAEVQTWRWALAARRRRERFRPDVVHAHLATPGLAGAAWWIAGATPLSVSFHLLPAAQRWPNDHLLRVPSRWVLEALQARRRRCVFVAVSGADRAALQERFPRAALALAPNWPGSPPSAAEAAPLPFAPGNLRLLSVGRLAPQKGFDRMLEALAQPAVRALPWQWLIVGEGAERGELKRAIARRALGERVHLLGALPSHGLYEQAELVLCPSRFEGAPLVPMEALRAGVPVLLSDIAAHRELSPHGLLPEREAEWPGVLHALFGAAAARDALRAQPAPLAADGGGALWHACATIYAKLLETRPHA